MITVKLFGRVRSTCGIKVWQTEECPKNILLLLEILSKEKNIDLKELKKSIMFLDGKPVSKMKGFKTSLPKTCELALLSAVAGG